MLILVSFLQQTEMLREKNACWPVFSIRTVQQPFSLAAVSLKGTSKRAWNSQTSRKKQRSTLAQGHQTDKDTSKAFTAKSTATDSHRQRERLLTEGSWNDCEGRYGPEPRARTRTHAHTHAHTGFIKLINQDDNRWRLGEETSEQEGWWDENTGEAQVHPSYLQLTCRIMFLFILNEVGKCSNGHSHKGENCTDIWTDSNRSQLISEICFFYRKKSIRFKPQTQVKCLCEQSGGVKW